MRMSANIKRCDPSHGGLGQGSFEHDEGRWHHKVCSGVLCCASAVKYCVATRGTYPADSCLSRSKRLSAQSPRSCVAVW